MLNATPISPDKGKYYLCLQLAPYKLTHTKQGHYVTQTQNQAVLSFLKEYMKYCPYRTYKEHQVVTNSLPRGFVSCEKNIFNQFLL